MNLSYTIDEIHLIITEKVNIINSNDHFSAKYKLESPIEYQIYSLHIQSTYHENDIKRYNFFISAGIHGNEKTAVHALVELIDQIPLLFKQYNIPFNLFLIPCCNVHGYIHNKRNCSNSNDLNRSFIINNEEEEEDIHSEESNILKKYLQYLYLHYGNFVLSLDLHSSLYVQYNGFFAIIAKDTIHKYMNILSQVMNNMHPYKLLKENISVYHLLQHGICYTNTLGTFKDYLKYMLHSNLSVTFEAPRLYEKEVQVNGLIMLCKTTILQWIKSVNNKSEE